MTLDKSRNHSVAQLSHKSKHVKLSQNLPLSCPHVRVAVVQTCALSSAGAPRTMLHPGRCSIDSSHQHMGSPTFGVPQTLQRLHRPAQSTRKGLLHRRPWGSTCCYRVLRGIILPTPPPEPAWEGSTCSAGQARVCHPLEIILLI